MFILGSLESAYSGLHISVNSTVFARCYGGLRRYERKQIENWSFRSNAVSLTQNFR